ncbi:aldehyde dehydrogenase family protein [Streptomyces sp. RTd22]|uniref:aldehyde dehydrogenase family protein n=1 Tax=Streptomyces sp. RTd22 TaxID=1841249 RepID=UPI0007C4DBDD|nr:aldehyde dehydrogenase family protein [Streptomyces sp. RTd22]
MKMAADSPRRMSEETQKTLRRPLFGHVVDGIAVESLDGATRPIVDPATDEQVSLAVEGAHADVDRAVVSARAAFEDGRWRNLPPMEEERRLHTLAGLLSERAETFIEFDVIDCGFLRAVAENIVRFAVYGIDCYAGWPPKIQGSVPPGPPGVRVSEMREPIGWRGPSFPGTVPRRASMAVFAVCAGNSVVLKPAEHTQMTSVLLAELAVEAGIPPGVFNVVLGAGNAVGAALVEHPAVESVFFIG